MNNVLINDKKYPIRFSYRANLSIMTDLNISFNDFADNQKSQG